MSHHFSHSVLGGGSAVSQNGGSPAKANILLEVAPPLSSRAHIVSQLHDKLSLDDKSKKNDVEHYCIRITPCGKSFDKIRSIDTL